MTWQLLLASCAAANLKPGLPPNPDPTADAAVEWDSSLLGVNLSLANLNRDVLNNGANGSNGIVTAVKPIRPSAGLVYWEYLVVALGAATNVFELGFITSMAHRQVSGADLGVAANGGIVMRSGPSTSNVRGRTRTLISGAPNINPVNTVINFAVEPATGKVWVGVNGTWITGAFGTPNTATGIPTVMIEPGLIIWPAVRPSDNGDRFRLQSIASHFSYSLPAGCKAYGSDLVDFTRHELPMSNVNFSVNNGTYTGWTVTADGTIATGSTAIAGFESSESILFMPFQANQVTGIQYYAQITTTAATFQTISQTFTFDSRFDALIDDNQMVLEMAAFIGRGILVPRPSELPTMRASFFDAGNVLIGSENVGPPIDLGPGQMRREFAYFDIPPNTRSIRVTWRILKIAGNSSRHYIFYKYAAAMLRKIPLLRVDTSNVMVLLGAQPDMLSVRASNVLIVMRPEPVSLLLHFDEADGSTTTTDFSPNSVPMTFVGNAQIDTAQSRFGGASLLLDGAGDRLTAPTADIWHFGLEAFTVEAQVRFNGAVTNQAFFGKWLGGNSWFFYIESGQLMFRCWDGTALRDLAVAWVPGTNIWYHVAADRTGDGTLRLYIDGVMVAKSTTYTHNIPASTEPFVIGAIGNTNTFPAYDFNGWMDEVRILRGIAAWATDAGFTPPTAAYPPP